MNYKDMMNAIDYNNNASFAAGIGNTGRVRPPSTSMGAPSGEKTYPPYPYPWMKPRFKPSPDQPKTNTIPEDLEGPPLIRIIDSANKKERPLYALQNASGTWTLEDGSVVSQAALEYLRSIGIVVGGSAPPGDGWSFLPVPPRKYPPPRRDFPRFPGTPPPSPPDEPRPPRFGFPGVPREGMQLYKGIWLKPGDSVAAG